MTNHRLLFFTRCRSDRLREANEQLTLQGLRSLQRTDELIELSTRVNTVNEVLLRQQQHHVPAGRGPPAFHEAEVPLRDAGVEREVELTAPAPLPPFAQLGAERGAGEGGAKGGGVGHGAP